MTIPMRPPLCMWCSRFDRSSALPVRCLSFPNGIPDDIFDARLSHITSVRGEAPFNGTVPPGWEQLAPGLDGPEDIERDTTAGWTSARRL